VDRGVSTIVGCHAEKRRPVRHRPPLNHSTVGVEPENPLDQTFGVLTLLWATSDPELELVVASHCHLTRFRVLRLVGQAGSGGFGRA
jgi:hypothetical protein